HKPYDQKTQTNTTRAFALTSQETLPSTPYYYCWSGNITYPDFPCIFDYLLLQQAGSTAFTRTKHFHSRTITNKFAR
ncbi:MAG: hypothetical protein LC687_03270, partial [Actinobacteria bacterium]|nr:hypothetical protein [Actinomycetota bacterium]